MLISRLTAAIRQFSSTDLIVKILFQDPLDLYSPRNDPDPEMIPNPEMIHKLTPKWSPFFLLVDPEMIPKELENGDQILAFWRM